MDVARGGISLASIPLKREGFGSAIDLFGSVAAEDGRIRALIHSRALRKPWVVIFSWLSSAIASVLLVGFRALR